jgi:hypothetical protein
MTTFHRSLSPSFAALPTNAVLELDEGVRLLTNIVGARCQIAVRVRIDWHAREPAPTSPMFTPIARKR